MSMGFGVLGEFCAIGVGLGTNAKGQPKFNSWSGVRSAAFKGGTFSTDSLGRALLVPVLATEGLVSLMTDLVAGLLTFSPGGLRAAVGVGCFRTAVTDGMTLIGWAGRVAAIAALTEVDQSFSMVLEIGF